MMLGISLLGLVALVGVWVYVLRRRRDVMNYHDLGEKRIHRHGDAGG